MHAVADFRARDQATAQRGAVHGDGFAGGEADAVAVFEEIPWRQQRCRLLPGLLSGSDR